MEMPHIFRTKKNTPALRKYPLSQGVGKKGPGREAVEATLGPVLAPLMDRLADYETFPRPRGIPRPPTLNPP